MTREQAKSKFLGVDWEANDHIPIRIGNLIDGLVNLGLLKLDESGDWDVMREVEGLIETKINAALSGRRL